VHTGFWWEDLRERDHLEDLGVDVRIILNMDIPAGLDWINLDEDRNRERALVNAVMNFRVP